MVWVITFASSVQVSGFDIHYSIFDILFFRGSFPIRLDALLSVGKFFRPAAALTPET